MGKIRPFAQEHVPGAAALHRRVFEPAESDTQDRSRRERYLRRVFLEQADGHAASHSLVYEEGDGVVGFLGVVHRRMQYLGRPILAAVGSQFIVDPDNRSNMVGIQLLQEYFQGPQDLSIADEANNSARMLWEGFGGATAPLYSLYWVRPLRPIRYALSILRARHAWAPVAAAAAPVAALLDLAAARVPRNPLRVPDSGLVADTASDERLWAYLSECHEDYTLRPDYHSRTWKWLLQRAEEKPDCGSFQRVVVRNGRESPLGWYLYYLNPGGTSEVVQLAAKRNSRQAVLNHLLRHAWQGGSAAVSGRLQPSWLPALSESRCVLYRGPWVLVHSRKPEIAQSFYDGTAWLSRLDGEWCLRYR